MPPVGRERRKRREIETVEDAEGEQRGEALPVRRTLPDPETAEADADRLVPGGPVRGKVVRAHHPAGALHGRGEVACDVPAIERVGAALRDGPERPGQSRVAEYLAGPGPAAVDRHRPAAGGPGEDPFGAARPMEGRKGRHGHAVFREADGGRERIGDADAPVPREQVAPPRAGPGHGDRMGVVRVGELGPGAVPARQALPAHEVDRQRARRPARAVQPGHPAGRGLEVQGEAVAPDAGGAGLGHVEHRGHGDRGVRGVAAVLEHAQAARLARGWLDAVMPPRAATNDRREVNAGSSCSMKTYGRDLPDPSSQNAR